jgi:ribosomal protein S18 acetylase RimI-like enzyme
MSVTGRPMRADEFDGWLATTKVAYVGDMVRAGVPEDGAREKGDQDFAMLLSAGVETEGQSLYILEDGDEVVGNLWLSERQDDLGETLCVYNVAIDEAYRGRGLGRAAMTWVEGEALRRGIQVVTLNVFGGNDVARGLYRSLGYDEIAVYMRKTL